MCQHIPMKKLLVANRGEIAVRIMHAAAELGIRTVAVFSEDDAARCTRAAPTRRARCAASAPPPISTSSSSSPSRAPRAATRSIPATASSARTPTLARRVDATPGITFVGPRPETLEIFGDKTRARALAERCGVPVLRGTRRTGRPSRRPREFLASLGDGGAMVIKAVAGGGGRGMRVVRAADGARRGLRALPLGGAAGVRQRRALRRAAHAARPPHRGADRRRRLAAPSAISANASAASSDATRSSSRSPPAPACRRELRARLTADAVRMAAAVRYRNAGTFEFLVDAERSTRMPCDAGSVRLRLHRGQPAPAGRAHGDRGGARASTWCASSCSSRPAATLAELGLEQADVPAPRGFAIQVRVNTETMAADGTPRPASGTLVGVRAALRPRRARRHLRLRRLSDQPQLRLAARQAHRPLDLAALRRRRGAHRARSRRAADRGRAHQRCRFCGGCCGTRLRRQPHPHALRRGARSPSSRAADGDRGQAHARAGARSTRPTRSPSSPTAKAAATAPPSAAPEPAAARCAADWRASTDASRCAAPMQGTIVSIDVARRRRRAARARRCWC